MKMPNAKQAPVRKMSNRPRIRMQKLKPVPAGAFPQSAAAFPTGGSPAGPDDAALGGPSGGMPSGAAPGVTGE